MTIYASHPLKGYAKYLVHEHNPVMVRNVGGFTEAFYQTTCLHYDIKPELRDKLLALGGRVSGCTLGDEEDHDE